MSRKTSPYAYDKHEMGYIRQHPDECTGIAIIKGVEEPCGKPAIAVARDTTFGGLYPVCVHHCRVGQMVPLRDLLEGR